jgi:Ni/Fe-hydrogenase 1 B-type cytochrome subunit
MRVVYVWELPVRTTHWINAMAIGILCLTGVFIGMPKTVAGNTSQYYMGWVRFVHFIAGYVLTISLFSRIYWSFVGNEYCRWRIFFPWLTAEGRHRMWEVFKFYTFLDRRVPQEIGLNGMAASVYLLVFLLYLFMSVSGFALYVQYSPNTILHLLFNWINVLVPSQWLRFAHHMAMWFLVGFVINHVYSGWLFEVKSKGGVMSSMFSGYKSVPE